MRDNKGLEEKEKAREVEEKKSKTEMHSHTDTYLGKKTEKIKKKRGRKIYHHS